MHQVRPTGSLVRSELGDRGQLALDWTGEDLFDVLPRLESAAVLGLDVEVVTVRRLHGAGEGATGGTVGVAREFRARAWSRLDWSTARTILEAEGRRGDQDAETARRRAQDFALLVDALVHDRITDGRAMGEALELARTLHEADATIEAEAGDGT